MASVKVVTTEMGSACSSNSFAIGHCASVWYDCFGATCYYSHSTAIGQDAIARGNYSTALGQGAVACGNYSTALGQGAVACGNYSTALGKGAYVECAYSIAIGTGAQTDGSQSISFANGCSRVTMSWDCFTTMLKEWGGCITCV